MQLYKKNTKEWTKVWAAINHASGYKVHDDYIVIRDGNQLTLTKSQNSGPLIRVCPDNTTWCCGVMQVGNFYEANTAGDIPLSALDEYYKILASSARNMFRKGILQGWFYREPRREEFRHPVIRQMFIRNGMRKIGRRTYNPNSGNQIQGYQASLRKGPR